MHINYNYRKFSDHDIDQIETESSAWATADLASITPFRAKADRDFVKNIDFETVASI